MSLVAVTYKRKGSGANTPRKIFDSALDTLAYMHLPISCMPSVVQAAVNMQDLGYIYKRKIVHA